VGVKDGIPENVPNAVKMVGPITRQTIGGNYVMEDIGGDRYAHLIPGAIGVKVGDSVSAGERLAKLRNSGNSTEPHLHFHVCDGPSPLLCNGLPFGDRPFQPVRLPDGDEGRASGEVRGWRPPPGNR
jgi:murein DD-endopeptidase MepM/ murein hydrolase activator NlpD